MPCARIASNSIPPNPSPKLQRTVYQLGENLQRSPAEQTPR